MIDALGYTFMQNALMAALLGSIACGIIGTLVTVNRMSVLAGSIAHASFGGLGLAYMAGMNPMIGAVVFAIGSALGIGVISRGRAGKADTAMAAIWATGMAMGLVFIKLSGTYSADLMSWLFGSLLTVSKTDVIYSGILDLLILVIVVGFYRELLAVSYDEEYSRLRGIHTGFIRGVFLVLTALTAVMLMKVTGLIMVIALLSIPAAIAENFTSSLWKMMVLASVLAAVISISGLALAWVLDLPPGAVIILVAALVYFLTVAIQRLRSGSA